MKKDQIPRRSVFAGRKWKIERAMVERACEKFRATRRNRRVKSRHAVV